MTPKEKIRVHVQTERENARKLREWKDREEIRLLNLQLAEEAMREIERMGVFDNVAG